jgi:predicted alpha/beta-hydrolase family hydrolase
MGTMSNPTSDSALLLFPGAGSSSTHSSLVAIEEALAPLPVQRSDFIYRREGRRAPDRAPKLMATVEDEAAALVERTGIAADRLLLGGRSMGGRMCSMVVAEGLPARGLILIAYPLHPPGKPEKLRIEHLPKIEVPCLFVSGTRDPFGTPEELEAHTAAIPGKVTHVWLEGARHELKDADNAIVDAIQSWLPTLP